MKNKLYQTVPGKSCMRMCAAMLLGAACMPLPKDCEAEEAGRTLTGVCYHTVNGMVYGADLYLDIRQERIASARYLPQTEDARDYTEIENAPIAPEQWEALRDAVEAVLPQMEEAKERKPDWAAMLAELLGVEATDGPYERAFYLTWADERGDETRIAYSIPDTPEFAALIEQMQEMAETGR